MDINDPDVIKTIGAFLGLGIAAFASGKDLKRQKSREKAKVTAEDIRKYFKAKTLDSTKRKSLQPSNQRPTPLGWTDEDESLWRQANQKPARAQVDTKRPKSNKLTEEGISNEPGVEYFHKFFGSRLLLDGYVIKGGLTNQLHALEITKGDRLYIDGNLVSIHPTELEKLKAGLRKIKDPSGE